MSFFCAALFCFHILMNRVALDLVAHHNVPSRYKLTQTHTHTYIQTHTRFNHNNKDSSSALPCIMCVCVCLHESVHSNNSYKSYRRFEYDAGVQTLLLSNILLHLCPSIFQLYVFFLWRKRIFSSEFLPYECVCVWVWNFVSLHIMLQLCLRVAMIKSKSMVAVIVLLCVCLCMYHLLPFPCSHISIAIAKLPAKKQVYVLTLILYILIYELSIEYVHCVCKSS